MDIKNNILNDYDSNKSLFDNFKEAIEHQIKSILQKGFVHTNIRINTLYSGDGGGFSDQREALSGEIKNKVANKKFSLPVGVPVFFAKNQTVSPYDDNEKLVAFAGIGYPKKFFNSLRNVVARRAFADHYEYTDEDLKKLFALAEKKKAKLITTEKDWVRLPVEIRDKIKYARLDTVIDNKFYDWLKEKVKCQHSSKK